MRYLFDPDGRVWNIDQLNARQQSGAFPISCSPQDLIETLVIERGYLGLVARDQALQLFFNRRKVSYVQLDAVLDKLETRQPKVVITASYEQNAWNFQLLGSYVIAMDHVRAFPVWGQIHHTILTRCNTRLSTTASTGVLRLRHTQSR